MLHVSTKEVYICQTSQQINMANIATNNYSYLGLLCDLKKKYWKHVKNVFF